MRATSPDGVHWAPRLPGTSLLAKNLYLEASVAFRLNGPGDAVTFGLSLPYTVCDAEKS